MSPDDVVLPHIATLIRPLGERTHRLRRAGEVIELMVLHAMAENVVDELGERGPKNAIYPATRWLDRSGLSAHALITPLGQIVALVEPTTHVAWHAKGFNARAVGVEFLVSGTHGYGSFLEAIGVDHQGRPLHPAPPSPFTEAQYAAGGLWLARCGLPWSAVRDHSELDPARKFDPGPLFQKSRLQAWFDRWMAAPMEARA